MDERKARLDVLEHWLELYSTGRGDASSHRQHARRSSGIRKKTPDEVLQDRIRSSLRAHLPENNERAASFGDRLSVNRLHVSEGAGRSLSAGPLRDNMLDAKPVLVNPKSELMVQKIRMHRIIDLYDRLDIAKLGYINLSDMNVLMSRFTVPEQEFLHPILKKFRGDVGPTRGTVLAMSLNDFVEVMGDIFREGVRTGPTDALLSSRSSDHPLDASRRRKSIYKELEEERERKFTFRPQVTERSRALAQCVRRGVESGAPKECESSKGDRLASEWVEQRCDYMFRERALWCQRRDALHMKQEAEKMAEVRSHLFARGLVMYCSLTSWLP